MKMGKIKQIRKTDKENKDAYIHTQRKSKKKMNK